MIYLETERLIIRDNVEGDLQGLYELTSNPIDMRYMHSTKIESYDEAVKHLNVSIAESKRPISMQNLSLQKTPETRMKYYFAIIDKTDETYIGAIGYEVEQQSPQGSLVELGYFIKHEFWNKGFVTEAGNRVLEYAFLENNVHKIEAGCLKENRASERIMIKLGMRKEADLTQHQFHENAWKDRLIYGLIKEDWLTHKNNKPS